MDDTDDADDTVDPVEQVRADGSRRIETILRTEGKWAANGRLPSPTRQRLVERQAAERAEALDEMTATLGRFAGGAIAYPAVEPEAVVLVGVDVRAAEQVTNGPFCEVDVDELLVERCEWPGHAEAVDVAGWCPACDEPPAEVDAVALRGRVGPRD